MSADWPGVLDPAAVVFLGCSAAAEIAPGKAAIAGGRGKGGSW